MVNLLVKRCADDRQLIDGPGGVRRNVRSFTQLRRNEREMRRFFNELPRGGTGGEAGETDEKSCEEEKREERS